MYHDGHVEGVSGRRGDSAVQHYRRTLDVPLFDRVHLIDHAEKRVERGLNGVPAFDRDVTMEDLLKDLRAGDKTFVIGAERRSCEDAGLRDGRSRFAIRAGSQAVAVRFW